MRLLNTLASRGKLSNTMTEKLRRFVYANKHLLVRMDNIYGRATYDTTIVESMLANGIDLVQDTLDWQALNVVKGSMPQWVLLYSNLSIDPRLIDL